MGQKCTCFIDNEKQTEQKLEEDFSDLKNNNNDIKIDPSENSNLIDNSLIINKAANAHNEVRNSFTNDNINYQKTDNSVNIKKETLIDHSNTITKDKVPESAPKSTRRKYDEEKIILITRNLRKWYYRHKFIKRIKPDLIFNDKLLFDKLLNSLQVQKLIDINSKCKKPYQPDDWQQFYSEYPINVQNLLKSKKDHNNTKKVALDSSVFGNVYKTKKIFLGKNNENAYNDTEDNSNNPNQIILKGNSKENIYSNSKENQKLKNYIYIGEVNKLNKKHGKGMLYYLDGSSREEGTWFEDSLIGWTRIIYSNGVVFEGVYQNRNFNGKGKIFMNDESIYYEGETKNNKKEGFGKEITAEQQYEGQFVDNKKCGRGSILFKKSGDIFEGEFKDNKMFYGKYIWKENDAHYLGSFFNNKMHGKGVYTSNNGIVYEGDYKDGKKHGIGTIKENNKIIYDGEFADGNPHGKGFIYDKKDKKVEVRMENGKKINDNKNKNVEPKKLGLKQRLIQMNQDLENQDDLNVNNLNNNLNIQAV